MPLQTIDITADNVKELMFAALRSHRGFVLRNFDSSFSQSAEDLFQSFDDFISSDPAKKESFVGAKDGISGYFPYERFHFSGKTTARFFICRDEDGNLTHPMPQPNQAKTSMATASQSLLPTINAIANQIYSAIELGLGLEPGVAQKHSNRSSLIAINHYLPTTQEMLRVLLEKNQLTRTKTGNVMSFGKHKDLSLFSMIICRRNKADGLEISYKDEQNQQKVERVTLDEHDSEIQVIVILGKVMEFLTSNRLKGLSHAVITEPLAPGQTFQRNTINIFVSVGQDIINNNQLEPFPRNTSCSAASAANLMSSRAYFEAHNHHYHNKTAQRAAECGGCPEIDQYPKQSEIASEITDDGAVVYRRVAP